MGHGSTSLSGQESSGTRVQISMEAWKDQLPKARQINEATNWSNRQPSAKKWGMIIPVRNIAFMIFGIGLYSTFWHSRLGKIWLCHFWQLSMQLWLYDCDCKRQLLTIKTQLCKAVLMMLSIARFGWSFYSKFGRLCLAGEGSNRQSLTTVVPIIDFQVNYVADKSCYSTEELGDAQHLHA